MVVGVCVKSSSDNSSPSKQKQEARPIAENENRRKCGRNLKNEKKYGAEQENESKTETKPVDYEPLWEPRIAGGHPTSCMYMHVFCQIWAILSHYFFKYFFRHSLLLLSFQDSSSDRNVKIFYYGPQISEVLFIFLSILFYLWFRLRNLYFIILSSSSLTLSSVLSILLPTLSSDIFVVVTIFQF